MKRRQANKITRRLANGHRYRRSTVARAYRTQRVYGISPIAVLARPFNQFAEHLRSVAEAIMRFWALPAVQILSQNDSDHRAAPADPSILLTPDRGSGASDGSDILEVS